MTATTKKLTIRLPEDHLNFVKRYAKEQGVTVTEVFDRYLRGLSAATGKPGPEVQRMTGILPAQVDARAEHRNFLIEKHSR